MAVTFLFIHTRTNIRRMKQQLNLLRGSKQTFVVMVDWLTCRGKCPPTYVSLLCTCIKFCCAYICSVYLIVGKESLLVKTDSYKDEKLWTVQYSKYTTFIYINSMTRPR